MAQSGIPVIDINSADEATIGKALVDAAEEHGFIYIRNLGQDIPAEQIDEAFSLVRPTTVLISNKVEPILIICNSLKSCLARLWRKRWHAPSRPTIAVGEAYTLRPWIPEHRKYVY